MKMRLLSIAIVSTLCLTIAGCEYPGEESSVPLNITNSVVTSLSSKTDESDLSSVLNPVESESSASTPSVSTSDNGSSQSSSYASKKESGVSSKIASNSASSSSSKSNSSTSSKKTSSVISKSPSSVVSKSPSKANTKPISRTVYRTPTGKKYHYSPTCGGKNSYAISIDEIGSLQPCKKCAGG